MIVGHLPAGYICSKLLQRHFEGFVGSSRVFIAAGIAGAVVPDLDMLHFYLIDHCRYHHHTYWTHYPIIWLALLCASAMWLRIGRKKYTAALAVIFSLNGVVHMVLDTIASHVWWFAPFWDKPFNLITVPIVVRPWWLNFFTHWSFTFELFIILWALLILKRSSAVTCRRQAPPAIFSHPG